MNAFSILLGRQGQTPDKNDFKGMLDAIDHYRVDCTEQQQINQLHIGVHRHHTLPQDPFTETILNDHESGTLSMFCGRLDNRAELTARSKNNDRTSDTEIVHQLYLQQGAEIFKQMVGPFVFVHFHKKTNGFTIARDALGDAPLYYYLDDEILAASTEPAGILSLPGMSRSPDLIRVAQLAAFQWPHTDRSYFSCIKELPPGHYLSLLDDRYQVRQYWWFEPDEKLRGLREGEVHELFRSTLTTAVEAQCRSLKPIAISLSGGLDSSSIAVEAKNRTDIRGFSWCFEQDQASDESSYISTLARHLDIPVEMISCDYRITNITAQGGPESLSINFPMHNTVTGIKKYLYAHIADQGHNVFLTGDSADELYLRQYYWLKHLIRDKKVMDFFTGLKYLVKGIGQGEEKSWLPFRLLFSQKIGIRRYFNTSQHEWVEPSVYDLIPEYAYSPAIPESIHPKLPYDTGLGQFRSSFSTFELHWIQKLKLERRNPYRDLRMVKLMLSLPAYYLFKNLTNKRIVRESYAPHLPMNIIHSGKRGSLQNIARMGIQNQKEEIIEILSGGQFWRQFIRDELILNAVQHYRSDQARALGLDAPIWNAVCIQSWKNKLAWKNKSD